MESTVNDSSATSDSQEESKFAGVVFHNVQEIYIPGKDIRCCFSIKPSVSTTANDWIGLYKVGWQSPKDYLCYEYSPVIEKGSELALSSLTASLSTQNSVVFRGQKLPSEECEFYQFCYVTSSGEIRGASYPFQISFTKPGDLECCEEEDESGDTLLIVKNRTALLEDSLAKAYDENTTLKALKDRAEAECLKYQDMILKLEENKSNKVDQLEKQKKLLDKVISEKTEFEESYKESVEQLKASRTALKIANEKAHEVQQQLENERLQHVQTSSVQQKFEEEKSQMLRVISHKDSIIQNFLDTIEENSGKTAALESEIQRLKSENLALQDDYDNLVVWKAKTDDSLQKSEQAKTDLEESLAEQFKQVGQLQSENSVMRDELAVTQRELEDLSNSFGDKLSAMQEIHQKEILHFESQVEMFSSQLDGREQELAVTKEKLDEILAEVEKERKAKEQQVQEYEDSVVKLQEQLSQERAFNNSLSSASDRQVAELQEQLNTQLQKNSSALQQIEDQVQEIKHLEESVKVEEEQIERMQSKIEEQAQQLEASKQQENEILQSSASDSGKDEKNAAIEGSYFALKTANGQLRKQYLQAKKDMENLWRQKTDLKRQLATVQSELPDSDLRFQLANLKKQIEDLRIRLNMGAEAYKAKFKECRKYESQLKKMQKDSNGPSCPNSPSSVTEFEIRNLKQSLENEKTTTAALKKSLENYKVDAHEAKEELSKIKKENEFLQRQVTKLEKDIGVCNEETQKRLVEDKELQSHIECLHSQLEAKCEALKAIEESCKTEAEKNESVIASLIEKNEVLQRAVEEEAQHKNEVMAERDAFEEKIKKNVATIEELREMAGLIHSVARHDETNPNQGTENVSESTREPVLTSSTVASPDGKMCPVCQIYFPPNSPQQQFEEHVYTHFKD